MDVPNSGAIFTLGKSYLAENTQSYFYIKNDPIKRLISGPHQSAVICESGRLFVWGENHYGQLGISGITASKAGNNTQSGDIITKPTCVKSLKTLGRKIADIAYGNNWAVILTYSNELFFSGRNIFGNEARISQHFADASIANETYSIIRKPFRLEEFDDCLSSSEDTENFAAVLAGNEHFAVMTSFGRLIGWGSNRSHQLGAVGGYNSSGTAPENDTSSDDSTDENLLQPIEILLDAPVRQFACGPESTLVLTESGNLFITGRLNDLVFTEFAILQKNLSATEQIIFMHISKASEIFIVTDAGSIFRSIESMRSKSLIFQRFYDYDSEENGPIWKLLKGSSFYAVLTKANKFYTTFSESGHHLKTFREINKFKNLRLLDMAVGDQHILVHGIPRSSTLSATMGPGGEHRFMSRTYVLPNAIINGGVDNNSKNNNNNGNNNINENNNDNNNGNNNINENNNDNNNGNNNINENNNNNSDSETIKSSGRNNNNNNNNNNKNNEVEDMTTDEKVNETPNINNAGAQKEIAQPEEKVKSKEDHNTAVTEDVHTLEIRSNGNTTEDVGRKSPAESIKSRKSQSSAQFDTAANSEKTTRSNPSAKLLRPRTPYPESSTNSTPQTIKKTPLRNYSYEAAMNDEYLERVTPPKSPGLDEIPETLGDDSVGFISFNSTTPITAMIASPTLSAEEDEELRVEISTTGDEHDQTIVVNEIRFINNGVDVTANVTENTLESESEEEDTTNNKKVAEVAEIDTIDRMKDSVSDAIRTTTERTFVTLEEKIVEGIDKVKDVKNETQKGLTEAVVNVESKVKATSEAVATTAKNITHEAVASVAENVKRIANDARQAVENVGQGAMKVTTDARQTVDNAFNKVTSEAKSSIDAVTTKISNEMQEAKDNLTTFLQPKSNAITMHEDDVDDEPSSKDNAGDDERTTASVNSNHTSSGGGGNPFENGNSFESSTNNLNETFERGKQMLRDEVNTVERTEAETKGRMRQFFDEIRAKSKNISCRNEKSVQIEDEPPRYSVSDELSTVNNRNEHDHGAGTNDHNTSKVCTIL